MNQKTKKGLKIVCNNRKAGFNYFYIDFFEAGIVLKGSEVKSLRDGRGNISESYAIDNKGEIFLINSHISAYRSASRFNHEPLRMRKILLHRREMEQLRGKMQREGYTLVPLSLYFNERGRVKVELGLAKGRRQLDKREREKTRDWERQRARLLRSRG